MRLSSSGLAYSSFDDFNWRTSKYKPFITVESLSFKCYEIAHLRLSSCQFFNLKVSRFLNNSSVASPQRRKPLSGWVLALDLEFGRAFLALVPVGCYFKMFNTLFQVIFASV